MGDGRGSLGDGLSWSPCCASSSLVSMRGVEKQNSFCVTSSMLGAFRESARTRMEFLELIKLRTAVRSSQDAMAACIDE